MKVCTDACLFGAWVAAQLPDDRVLRGLDIGTGTGLLSLMLAQERAIDMTAIDIDANACKQAGENALAASFGHRVTVQQMDVRAFQPSQSFDIIICNPPFFKQSLLSAKAAKNLSKHEAALDLGLLLQLVNRWMAAEGIFFLLLPYSRADEVEKLAQQQGFGITQKRLVRQTAVHPFFRVMYALHRSDSPSAASETGVSTEMCIREADNKYSADFLAYLSPFYLPIHYK